MPDTFGPDDADPASPHTGEGEPPPANLPMPWDEPPEEEEDEDGVRRRHDAFTARRRNEYLKALQKTGCVLDACRLVGVSPRTIYYHQGQDAGFLKLCTLAVSMCETPVELTAWERAVSGIEEQVVVGGRIVTRVKRSDSLQRLLLQGANPKKYGARPGFTRKRMLKAERKQMEREVRAEIASRRMSFEEAIEKLDRQLGAMAKREEPKKLAAGWTRSPEGEWVPPGYGPLDAPRDPRDSV